MKRSETMEKLRVLPKHKSLDGMTQAKIDSMSFEELVGVLNAVGQEVQEDEMRRNLKEFLRQYQAGQIKLVKSTVIH